MSSKPMLGDWEIPRVVNLQTLERRSMAALRIPGVALRQLSETAGNADAGVCRGFGVRQRTRDGVSRRRTGRTANRRQVS